MGWSSCTVRLYKGKNKIVDDKKTGGKKLDEISYITKRKKKTREWDVKSVENVPPKSSCVGYVMNE